MTLLKRAHAHPTPIRCLAVVSLDTFCGKPPIAGSLLCPFHAGLKGPWAHAIRLPAEDQPAQKRSKRRT
jgi:hypothetical protein